MQGRAGKSVKISVHDKPAVSDASLLDLQRQRGYVSTNHVSLHNFCDTPFVSKSNGKCWFETDSEASDSSDIGDVADQSGDQPAFSNFTASCPCNTSRSPPRNYHNDVAVLESTSDIRISSVSGSGIHVQDVGSNLSVQNPVRDDGVTPIMTHAFLPEAFAPTVMPWFKAKRKSTNK
jgi:hypothetical protein